MSCVIELRLRTIAQLFNSLDPSPFTERDLDRDAVEFMVSAAGDCGKQEPLVLRMQFGEPAGEGDIEAAIRNYFRYRAELAEREMREHLRIARITLTIGLAVLLVGNVASTWVSQAWPGHLGQFAATALLIGAWVAMWRPLELYLYDWWPILRRRRVYQRLSNSRVELTPARDLSTAR
ncbi:MAG: hypothetical protein H6981_05850 [Gammaproteobacteria bacterium]|nr:hypothetical protein [Gammaproteobacteria bacterium]MCP5136306.1 hypothetical protein [Gammaproteobacteria bacterium]